MVKFSKMRVNLKEKLIYKNVVDFLKMLVRILFAGGLSWYYLIVPFFPQVTISLMYSINNSGPTDPCGTPQVVFVICHLQK